MKLSAARRRPPASGIETSPADGIAAHPPGVGCRPVARRIWALAILIGASAAARAASITGSLESGPGFHVATFSVPAGRIYVNLPDDMAPGDTVSATVNPLPAGTGDAVQARQRLEMGAYSVELAGQRAPAAAGVRTFAVPPGTALAIRLLDERGRPAAEVQAPLRGTVVATGTYRNVAVRLSAPLTNLLSGQRTTLTVTVSGVEGLKETLPLRLSNQSPDVVRMEGGEEQILCVRPDEVGTTGTWTKTRGLTGVRAGGFSIQTEVTEPGPQVESSAVADTILHGDLLARLALERPARTAAGQTLTAGPYQVVVRGTSERGRVRLYLSRDGHAAGTADGAVLKRVAGGSLCDRRDVTDAQQKAAAGSGERGFDELGFASGAAFDVRAEGNGLRLVLPTSDGIFSIEAPLAP